VTTEELAEVFLVHLYDLAEAAPHPNFLFTVNDFAPRLRTVDAGELQRALTSLGDRGLVFLATMDAWGGISAAITMEGSVFVEKGGETGIIARYRKDPGAFLTHLMPGPVGPPEPGPEPLSPEKGGPQEREEGEVPIPTGRAIEAILADMEDMLERDRTISAVIKRDALADLATLRLQLARNVKNRQVIDAILADLSAIPSIMPLVTGLRCIAETYLR